MSGEAQIAPARTLRGAADVPGDKSIAHRALFCGAMASGWTRISGVPRGADVSATIRALNACGVQIQRNGDAVIVQGHGREAIAPREAIDCANSGTTMRLLMGVLAACPETAHLYGDASLSRRPMRRVGEPLERMGAAVAFADGGRAPLDITGGAPLTAVEYELPVPSAQVKTAMMFAALAAEGRTQLRGAIRSRDHTERMLPQFGANVDVTDTQIALEGGQRLRGAFVEVPGDPSSAAYWIAAALLVPDSEIEIRNVSLNPTRLGFIEILKRMGGEIAANQRRSEPEPIGSIHARSSVLHGVSITADEVPSLIDELPLVAVLATQANGVTMVRGAAELRAKESDRIETVAAALRSMGATIETFEDGFAIEGPQALRGAVIETQHDHRIAMASAVAALVARGDTTIRDAECVGISYPGFFSTLRALGGDVR